MEQQQKLLWTIFSVAILVLVLLGAGMFFFIPEDSTGTAKGGKVTTPVEWSKPAVPVQTAVPAATPVQIQPAVPAATPVQIQPAVPAATPVQIQPAVPAATPVQIQPAAASMPTESKRLLEIEPARTDIAETKTPVQVEKKSYTTVQTVPMPAKKKIPAAVATPAPVKTEASNKTLYWIQVGSFGSMDTAENIKEQLSESGYKSRIQTVYANGKTLHRVKLGPYATKAKVDSVLVKIKVLDGMDGSFITTK